MVTARADTNSLAADTIEKIREVGRNGFPLPLHGHIKIGSHEYPFVTGGRGRGSAPFGKYHIGYLGGFRAPRGTFIPGFPLSNIFDDIVGDERSGLFIHPGHLASAGCIAIESGWNRFVSDMKKFGPTSLVLEPGLAYAKSDIIRHAKHNATRRHARRDKLKHRHRRHYHA